MGLQAAKKGRVGTWISKLVRVSVDEILIFAAKIIIIIINYHLSLSFTKVWWRGGKSAVIAQ